MTDATTTLEAELEFEEPTLYQSDGQGRVPFLGWALISIGPAVFVSTSSLPPVLKLAGVIAAVAACMYTAYRDMRRAGIEIAAGEVSLQSAWTRRTLPLAQIDRFVLRPYSTGQRVHLRTADGRELATEVIASAPTGWIKTDKIVWQGGETTDALDRLNTHLAQVKQALPCPAAYPANGSGQRMS
jgi:hypothetical protein